MNLFYYTNQHDKTGVLDLSYIIGIEQVTNIFHNEEEDGPVLQIRLSTGDSVFAKGTLDDFLEDLEAFLA